MDDDRLIALSKSLGWQDDIDLIELDAEEPSDAVYIETAKLCEQEGMLSAEESEQILSRFRNTHEEVKWGGTWGSVGLIQFTVLKSRNGKYGYVLYDQYQTPLKENTGHIETFEVAVLKAVEDAEKLNNELSIDSAVE